MKKKIVLLYLILTMVLGMGMNAYAEETAPVDIESTFGMPSVVINDSGSLDTDELRQQANNKMAELEQIYGIKIVFEDNPTSALPLSMQLNYLSLLEESIMEIPTELYSSARAQLAAKGQTLTVCFYQGGNRYGYELIRQGGFYTPDMVTIKLDTDALYMYPTEFIQTFLHEYGHMLHFTLLDYAAIESRWMVLNGDVQYTNEMWYSGDTNSSQTFISSYASSSYSEDFAESFSYFAMLPGDVIQQKAMKEPGSPIIQKMLLLREILSESFAIDPLILLPF